MHLLIMSDRSLYTEFKNFYSNIKIDENSYKVSVPAEQQQRLSTSLGGISIIFTLSDCRCMDNSFRLRIVSYSSSDCCVISYTTLCIGLSLLSLIFLHPSIVEISEVVLSCNTVQFLVQPEQVLFNYSITRSSIILNMKNYQLTYQLCKTLDIVL